MFCTKCGKEFEGNFCPNCGTAIEQTIPIAKEETPAPIQKSAPAQISGKTAGIVVIIAIVLFVGGMLKSVFEYDESKPTQAQTEVTTAVETTTTTTTKARVEFTTKVTEPIDTSTLGERNALSKAKDYLDYTAFSYSGLIEQLEYEKFTHDEAVYGADNCGADWEEQAALKAQSYIEYTSFSRQDLIDQLVYEGFTKSQAEYGVNAVGY